MKRLFTLCFILFCIASGLDSYGATLRISSNEPSALTVIWKEYTGRGSLIEHEYEIPADGVLILEDVNQYSYRYIKVKESEDYLISGIKIDGEGIANKDNADFTQWYVYPQVQDGVVEFSVEVSTVEEFYNGVIYMNVDDPEALNIRFNSDRYVTGLQAGVETPVRFNPELENLLYATPKDYEKSIFFASLNGDEVSFTNYNGVGIKDGDKIVIEANFPDEDAPVTFDFAEGAEEFITRVTDDGEDIVPFKNGFSAGLGSKITLYYDDKNFEFESVTVNGVPLQKSYYDNTVSFILTRESVIGVHASPYAKINFTLDVDNADNVAVYRGYSYFGNRIILENGVNNVSITENDEFISFVAQGGADIISITDGSGKEYYNPDDWSITVTPYEGMSLTVITQGVERNLSFALFIENTANVEFNRADYSSVSLKQGFSIIPFYEGDSPFYISLEGSAEKNVYLNDVKLIPNWDGGSSFYAYVNDGDVLKIFNVTTPNLFELTFDVEEDMDIEVTMDTITPVTDFSESYSVLTGTPVAVSFVEKEGVKVTLNDEEVAVADGYCMMEIQSDSKIGIYKDSTVGISEIANDQIGGIYDITSRLVMERATKNELDKLPAGIYIFNNQKIMKR